MSEKLIGFVRARVDEMDTEQVPLAVAMRKIVDEYERVDSIAAFPDFDGGRADGLEFAVIALANIWREHADWRDEWWSAG